MSKVSYEVKAIDTVKPWGETWTSYHVYRLQGKCDCCKHEPQARLIAEFPRDAKEFADSYVTALNEGKA